MTYPSAQVIVVKMSNMAKISVPFIDTFGHLPLQSMTAAE